MKNLKLIFYICFLFTGSFSQARCSNAYSSFKKAEAALIEASNDIWENCVKQDNLVLHPLADQRLKLKCPFQNHIFIVVILEIKGGICKYPGHSTFLATVDTEPFENHTDLVWD